MTTKEIRQRLSHGILTTEGHALAECVLALCNELDELRKHHFTDAISRVKLTEMHYPGGPISIFAGKPFEHQPKTVEIPATVPAVVNDV